MFVIKTRMAAGVALAAFAMLPNVGPAAALAAEQSPSAGSPTKDKSPAFAGHAYIFVVDNGNIFRNSYSADGRYLHWKTLAGPNTGAQETDQLQVAEVGRKVYFVSWVEKSGLSVSHVMDLNTMTVRAFWTFNQGKRRVGELHTGKLVDLGPSSCPC